MSKVIKPHIVIGPFGFNIMSEVSAANGSLLTYSAESDDVDTVGGWIIPPDKSAWLSLEELYKALDLYREQVLKENPRGGSP